MSVHLGGEGANSCMSLTSDRMGKELSGVKTQ